MVAGDLINHLIEKHKVAILPVDSEHSAIFSLLKDKPSNLIRNIGFTYKLLMSREYCGSLEESKDILLDFNKFLKNNSVELYRASNRITNKKVPFILIWRLFNINLYKLR